MDDIPYIEVAYDIDFNEEEAEDITEFIKNKIPQKYKYSIKKVLKYNKSSVVLQAEDGTYNCKIKSDTYFVNNYKVKVGDNVVVIYNYDEKVISKNDNSNEKHVEARRIYKEKEED